MIRFWPKLSSESWAAVALAFVLTAMKKWEPGGNMDTIWYAAVARNVFETANFHHFQISPYFYPTVADHMPLTYWITARMYQFFGMSDFVARVYPIVASFFSYVFVYLIGREIKDRHYGLTSVLTLVLAYGFSKWNGNLMHDVPLTTYFLACVCFFLWGLKKQGWFILSALAFVLGVMTKGPIIGAVALAIPIWIVCERKFDIFRKSGFYVGILSAIIGFSIFLLPGFQLDGKDPFTYFYLGKRNYLNTSQENFSHYFAYLEVLWSGAVPLVLVFMFSLRNLFKTKDVQNSIRRLCLLVAVFTIIPLSFFQVKFPHYMLPVYPFIALVAAEPLYQFLKRYQAFTAIVVQKLAIAAMALLVFLPIPITGGRSKTTLNLINLIKFDPQMSTKQVAFLGSWSDDMSIFQSFKWYGGLDLMPLAKEQLEQIDFAKTYLIVQVPQLPLKVKDQIYNADSCLFKNTEYCVLTDRKLVSLKLPDDFFPHQIYSMQK